jgi:hypothetical protein
MVWAKAALVGGLLVVLAAFALGTEHQTSTMVMGQEEGCGAAISASWLVSGTPDLKPAACGPVIRQSRVLVVGAMTVGGLLALVGWSAIRRRPAATGPGLGAVSWTRQT